MFSWIVDNPVSSVLFFVSFVCLVQAWLLKKDFFSPVNVYCFSQCITLAVAYLKLDHAMTDFKLKTWIFWIGALVCFCAGGFLVNLVARIKSCPVNCNPCVRQYGYNWKLHVLLAFGTFLMFLVGVAGIVHTAGQLLVFVDDPAEWMTQEPRFGYFGIFFSGGPLTVLLFALSSFSRFNPVKSLRMVSRFMVVFTIIFAFLSYFYRTSLFFSIGFIIILYNYLHKRVSAFWMLFSLVFAIGAFMGISALRSQQYMGSLKKNAVNMVALLPYRYVANNYWNLDYAINPTSDMERHPPTYGIDFFSGMLEYTGMTTKIKKSNRWDSPFQESVQKRDGFNTVSYLWEVYKDWGFFGVLLVPLICGMALSVFYLRLSKPYTPRDIAFYTYFIYFVGWWFFSPSYKQGLYWFWMFLLYFVTTVCMKCLPLPANAPVLDKVSSEEEGEEQVSAQGEEGDAAGLAKPGPEGTNADV